MNKKVVVASGQGKRALAGWLKDNDPETLELITGFSQDFGTLQEVSYKNLNQAKQGNLRNIMSEARKKNHDKHMSNMREKLK